MILLETVPIIIIRDPVSNKKVHQQQFQKCSETINSQSTISNLLSSNKDSNSFLLFFSGKALILEYELKAMNRL